MFNAGWTRIICVLLVVALVPMMTAGCIGSFAAWHKLKDWNTGMNDSKWVQELVFLVLNIIPVYGIAYLIDYLIINSIEFWTGENPMMTAQTVVGEDGSVATITPVDGDRLAVTVVAPDGSQREFSLERGAHEISAYDADGNLMVRASQEGTATEIVHGSQ